MVTHIDYILQPFQYTSHCTSQKNENNIYMQLYMTSCYCILYFINNKSQLIQLFKLNIIIILSRIWFNRSAICWKAHQIYFSKFPLLKNVKSSIIKELSKCISREQINFAYHLIYITVNLKLKILRIPQEQLEDTKRVIGICKSKVRPHNAQKKKDKTTNNDLQNIHIKLKIE